ncbi:MAG: hypothetical protein IJ390_09880 [Lachnospiraceae bacterium]|nr:hypothetical protein [Lachnospiraceae bacterium]
MLMILIQWCYMAALCFVTGFTVLVPFEKKGGYRVRHVTSCMMAGMLVIDVFAQYYSLFDGVGLWANLLMLLAAVAAAVLLRRDMLQFLKEKKKQWRPLQMLVWAALFLLFAYGSSRGYMHYDTGLYHAQSIRWIEEYGVVPGLANLHSRFGYNSAAFALCAFFGGCGLTKYPMHCVAGFFALVCAVKCTALMDLPARKRVRLSDFLYIGCIFYLVAVFRELVSPASDYFAILILFFVVMTWIELLEQKEKRILPYALLSEYLVYAATVKLSSAALLVLVLYPAVMLLKEKKWAQIGGYLALGVIIAFPYLARNVIISGWLFYPFTFFDIFDVDWKISKGYADSDAAEIQVYAKEIFDVYQKDRPFMQWFPNWLSVQNALDRVLVLTGWLAVPTGIVLMAISALRTLRGKQEALPFMVLQTAALSGFLFWQFGAPLVRYGYFYVLCLPLVTFGILYLKFFSAKDVPAQNAEYRLRRKQKGFWLFGVILVAFLCYRGYNLVNMVLEFGKEPYYVWQQDYGTFEAETYEVDGVTIYVPKERGQIGYDKFPSSPIVQDIELRDGENMESGFRKKESEIR